MTTIDEMGTLPSASLLFIDFLEALGTSQT
jgi:hypothetical protein